MQGKGEMKTLVAWNKEKLRQVKDKVSYILENFPETRECDKLLTLYYNWEFCGWHEYILTKNTLIAMAQKMIVPEDIRRVRQKLQHEKGLYLPEDMSVINKRKLLSQVYKKSIKKV